MECLFFLCLRQIWPEYWVFQVNFAVPKPDGVRFVHKAFAEVDKHYTVWEQKIKFSAIFCSHSI
jgi:hypothetical protein